MSAYSEFFLNSNSSVVQLECLEISHSAFSETYYIVRNASLGVTVTHEDDTIHDYTYYPCKLSLTGPRDDLDHILKVELGDLGELIPEELDNIRAADLMAEKPQVIYRVYRSDALTTVLYGPLKLEISTFTFNKQGAAFEAKAPSLNVSKTGELYTLGRFPMLRGVL